MLEVCIDNPHGLEICQHADVTRIELCAALSVGGLTPSAAFINLATNLAMDVYVLIRPRPGHFCFNEREVSMMCNDIAYAVDAGAKGVVVGAATETGTLNLSALRKLCKAAGSAEKTLHRVIDTMHNPLEAMEQAIDLGFSTILSSGGEPRAEDGVKMLKKLHDQAANRLNIMAGAGLAPSQLALINQQTGVSAFHSSCSQTHRPDKQLTRLGFTPPSSRTTDAALIKQFQLALKAIKRK